MSSEYINREALRLSRKWPCQPSNVSQSLSLLSLLRTTKDGRTSWHLSGNQLYPHSAVTSTPHQDVNLLNTTFRVTAVLSRLRRYVLQRREWKWYRNTELQGVEMSCVESVVLCAIVLHIAGVLCVAKGEWVKMLTNHA